MNQILYTGGKNGKGGMPDSKKIIIIFAVVIIIFGICLIGAGANLFNKVKNNKTANTNTTNTISDNPNLPEEPEESKIEIEFDSQVGEVKIIVNSSLKMKSITYWWEEEEPTVIETDEKEYETVIPSRKGTHTLNVEVTDEKGTIETVNQLVIGDSEPELTISTDGISNYVIKAKDDEEIDKIVIALNGVVTEELEVNAKEIEHKVAIPQGDSIIDVTVYNLNGISINKKAKITNFGG